MVDARTAFSDSNDISGSSSICYAAHTEPSFSAEPSPPGLDDLRKLSDNLQSIFDSSLQLNSSFADAKLVVADGRELRVHRCILSARSPFFRTVFSDKDRGTKLELKDLAKDFVLSFESVANVLSYLYSGKVKPLPESVFVCADEECSHAACRPAVEFVVEVLYASFTFQISELVSLSQGHLLDNLDKIVADDLLVVLGVADICGKVCEKLLTRCIDNIIKSDIDVTTLEKSLSINIVKQIVDSRFTQGFNGPGLSSYPDKHVKRIHRALDSDDVELLRLLLKEGHTTLDDACALHYAVAFCDAKTTTELLDLSIADVNLRNSRGYTVLHIAAMRKEPKLIVSLLTKGAEPSDLTPDGRNALKIAKRLTRAVEYNKPKEEGKVTPKDSLCIEILEQAEGRAPLLGEASLSLALGGDDVRMQLLYFENRVTLARLLFPMEAKVAMDIAHVSGTSEFLLAGARRSVDLNDVPFKIKEEQLKRLRALSKTVELGKRFFPRCSKVLDKIMDAEDLSELGQLEEEEEEETDERHVKRQKYIELQEIVGKAFEEDKEEFDRSQIISSSSSTSGVVLVNMIGRNNINDNNGRFTFRN
ncbi:BTB/POZ domain and ankyrin repeat-containing protein NPR1-like [Impatiens glandulifera]|uniref:BTB/POZ domain and ankyrin repeat-containing protein NPR1-like n=1 Tax=Impatiens glandulifera TaxID=253017 RepID=UPI001FB178C9|nr:BTB/POZ domain and ankyrin repeat-containing protein NPR1-like [Impatiens glandulifera]